MKKVILFLTIVSLSACNCKKNTKVNTTAEKISTIESQCPEDGKCIIKLLKNKAITYKTDELGIGYYTLDDNAKTSVILYQYNRNIPEGLMDAGHTEELLFEIKNNDENLFLNNSDLQKTKMVFGRICFCRGQMGYFKIEDGTLMLQKNRETISFNLDFKVTQVPQLFTKVKAIVK